ncbi:tyrosine phosphatase family-domain-containing protein [Phaeosphaeriaceae sp. PMI808]|nr:tyrosine phosphatase family-domain-containing protein [Phaeosphaeriaceae sp. PMI808]
MYNTLAESTATTVSKQTAEQSQFEMIMDYLEQLELPASIQLMRHAASTTHEDLPHDHECGISCMTESRGTTTPACSILSGVSRLDFLFPPSNFGAVLPGIIYRSSYPQEKNYEYIKDLKIKSILTLVPEPITPEYQTFMKSAGIQHFQVHIKANKGEVRVESCEMSRALRLIMDRTNHPILIHCNKGKHRTGCTVACFRRIIGYEMDTIVEDYHTYAGVKARFMDEVFFEGFDLNNVMWMARQEGWVAPEIDIDIALPSPPISPVTALVSASSLA